MCEENIERKSKDKGEESLKFNDEDEDLEYTPDVSAAIMCTDGPPLSFPHLRFRTYTSTLISTTPTLDSVGVTFTLY
ncbi:hypothetical protein BofuT4_uP077980.1 [Botrytis cinerea T4]|uniref:Uncharacterized protein n=1 Tax=Botryotinia fuckeliana (strain T4) TaxID=999810 RepID=G2YLK7_BOTF4|nr:hypothetical protein BofuT4_uP077980.1 [Botrytis cinerea T4]